MDDTTRFRGGEVPRMVLVVDDEPDVRGLIADYLWARGPNMVEAENGLEALRKFWLVRPQAVVLDILMPRLGGLRALKRIRSFDQNIAVIAVTGAMDDELQEQVLASGVTRVLPKSDSSKRSLVGTRRRRDGRRRDGRQGAPALAPGVRDRGPRSAGGTRAHRRR